MDDAVLLENGIEKMSLGVDPHLGLVFGQPNFAKCHDLKEPRVHAWLVGEE